MLILYPKNIVELWSQILELVDKQIFLTALGVSVITFKLCQHYHLFFFAFPIL
jgi:hypothetical protein